MLNKRDDDDNDNINNADGIWEVVEGKTRNKHKEKEPE